MSKGKIITGIAVGTLIALVLIPSTRKMITEGLKDLRNTLRDFADGAEDLADKSNDVADSVRAAEHAIK